MLLVRLNATLASKMSVPGYDRESVEIVLRNLRAMPLAPGPAQRDAIARLRPHLEEALSALDHLERARGLSTEERQQQEALHSLRSAIEELE